MIATSRDIRLNNLVRKVSDRSLNLEGFRCAMESLTNRWCELEDAKELLEMKVASRETERAKSDLPLELMDRHMPALFDWFSKIRAGVAPATNADSERQERVILREALVRAARSKGAGVIAEFSPLYDNAPDDQNRFFALRQIITRLVGLSCTEDFSSGAVAGNPLFDIYNRKLGAYYLLGLEEIPTNNGYPYGFCTFDPFTQWPNDGGFTPDLVLLKDRYNSWVDQAADMVTREMNQVLLPDALILLMGAL